MVNVSFQAPTIYIAVLLAIARETIKVQPVVTVPRVSRAHASRAALPARFSVMASASRRVRIIFIVVPLATVKAITRVRPAATERRVSRAHASRAVSQVKSSVMVSALLRARIISIAAHRVIVKTHTRAKRVRWEPPVSRAHASRAALPARFSVMVSALPRARIISIAVPPVTARETTKVRLAAMALRASRAPASRVVSPGRCSVTENVSPREPI